MNKALLGSPLKATPHSQHWSHSSSGQKPLHGKEFHKTFLRLSSHAHSGHRHKGHISQQPTCLPAPQGQKPGLLGRTVSDINLTPPQPHSGGQGRDRHRGLRHQGGCRWRFGHHVLGLGGCEDGHSHPARSSEVSRDKQRQVTEVTSQTLRGKGHY